MQRARASAKALGPDDMESLGSWDVCGDPVDVDRGTKV